MLTPVATKAYPLPPHNGLGTDDHEDLQDRREPTIELDKEQAIIVAEPDLAPQLTAQHNQLMLEHCIFSFKSALRLERRSQDSKYKAQQRNHGALTLGDFFRLINADEVFGTHRHKRWACLSKSTAHCGI